MSSEVSQGDSSTDAQLRGLLADVLAISPGRVDSFAAETPMFGALPELDSMAVAHLLTAIEERAGVLIEDDDVEAEDFATYGSLLAFVERLRAR